MRARNRNNTCEDLGHPGQNNATKETALSTTTALPVEIGESIDELRTDHSYSKRQAHLSALFCQWAGIDVVQQKHGVDIGGGSGAVLNESCLPDAIGGSTHTERPIRLDQVGDGRIIKLKS